MDIDDFPTEEDYWDALCEARELCGECYAHMSEHDVDEESEKVTCPK